MTLAYRCALAPLDQAATSLGWSPGFYLRSPCGLGNCNWWDETLQFLADPGSPVVAPVPLRVLSTSPFIVMPEISWTDTYGRISHWGDPAALDRLRGIRIRGLAPAVPAGARLDKGGLLGRVAPRERGVKWSVWGDGRDAGGIVSLFHDLGLDIADARSQDVAGFDRTPQFGGRLLARAGGTADCSAGVHGLRALDGYLGYLGSASDYVAPDSSVYARYGTSSQTDVTPPVPSHENVSPAAAGAGVGGVLLLLGLAGAWWLSRR